jgi:hypothetical protein
MSAAPAVTAQDLELEHAELLPARETLMVSIHPNPGGPMYPYPGPVYPWNPWDPGPYHPM